MVYFVLMLSLFIPIIGTCSINSLTHTRIYTHLQSKLCQQQIPVFQLRGQPWPSVHSVIIRNVAEWHIQFRRLRKYRSGSHHCKWCQSTLMTMLCFEVVKSWQLMLIKDVINSLDIDAWTPDGWCVFCLTSSISLQIQFLILREAVGGIQVSAKTLRDKWGEMRTYSFQHAS